MKVKFNPKNNKWEESSEGLVIDGYLKKKLDNVKMIIDKNWSATILIDGDTRSGKSTLAMLIAWYLSNMSFTINNFAQGLSDCADKIRDLPEKSILIVDEGSLSFSSRDTMKKEQKVLMKILDVVAQKNLTIIICLPSFFELNKSIATYHSLFLLHVYSDNSWNRGYFAYFSKQKKKKLYISGKKNFGSYSWPKADFVTRFSNFQPPFYNDYLKLKKRSMMEALKGDDTNLSKLDVSKLKTEFIMRFKKNCPEVTNEVISKGFGIGKSEFYRRQQNYLSVQNADLEQYNNITIGNKDDFDDKVTTEE